MEPTSPAPVTAAARGRTAPAPSVPAGVARSLARITEQGREIAALAAGDDPALRVRAERISAWAVAQQLEHLGVTGVLIVDTIESILAEPDAPAGGRPNVTGWLVLVTGRIPRGRAQARPEWVPSDASPERARRGIAELAARTAAIAARAAEIDGARVTRPHPLLGRFDARRWLRFLAIHQEHHLRLIRDIRAAAGLAGRT